MHGPKNIKAIYGFLYEFVYSVGRLDQNWTDQIFVICCTEDLSIIWYCSVRNTVP